MTGVSLVLCTAPPAAAPDLARRVVDAGLAACVNLVGPVRSIYRWQGAVQDDAEMLLLIKVARSGVAELSEKLREWHEYDVPEVVEVAVDGGSPAYLDWVLAACARDSGPAEPRG